MDSYDKMLFTPNLMDKKWKIGKYLFKITELLLQKFLVNLERAHILHEGNNENILLTQITNVINNSRVSDFILKSLEVVVSTQQTPKKIGERFNPVGIENKIWNTYVQNQDLKENQKRQLREMIASVSDGGCEFSQDCFDQVVEID